MAVMNAFTPSLARLYALSLFMFLWSTCGAQIPRLGDSKMKTTEIVRVACRDFNALMRRFQGQDSAASFFEAGDTLWFRVSEADEALYTFTFFKDQCVEMSLKLSCLSCFQIEYRKYFFHGKWRVDGSGYLYRSKNPARASIRRAVDCPYLYKVDIRSMEEPLPRDSFKKMRKVKKKWLGTLDSVMDEKK